MNTGKVRRFHPHHLFFIRFACSATVGTRSNFILGTGCDLPLETPPESIAAIMLAAGELWREQVSS